MDTDDLTDLAYKCIIYADEATGILKTELGAECRNHSSEDDYLRSIKSYVNSIKDNPEEYLDSWNLIEEVEISHFLISIEKLLKHIKSTQELSVIERRDSIYPL